MKILIVGGGGREHALAWKFAQSDRVSRVYVAPGNGGTALMAKGVNVDIAVDDLQGLRDFAISEQIDMTVIGPEIPLVAGVTNVFKEAGLKVFGPDGDCARLEGSKGFSKLFMEKYNIPTARFMIFDDYTEARKNAGVYGYPVVVKADGLAAGKGVVIAKTEDEALEAMEDMMVKRIFGEAGETIVLEEFLGGLEASMLCLVDGKNIVQLESVQDYKRIGDGNEGPNTGGMGTYSPNLIYSQDVKARVEELVIKPIMEGFEAESMDFRGVLFVGLMIDGDEIRVLEFNVRFGDPETQALMPKLANDIVDVTEAVIDQRLDEIELKWNDDTYICVVLASEGYPGPYAKGVEINGLDNCNLVFHSGTKLEGDKLVTSGGRVMGVIGHGDGIDAARDNVYAQVQKVHFDGMQYRTDIGKLIRH